jgi:hypothetical protein
MRPCPRVGLKEDRGCDFVFRQVGSALPADRVRPARNPILRRQTARGQAIHFTPHLLVQACFARNAMTSQTIQVAVVTTATGSGSHTAASASSE